VRVLRRLGGKHAAGYAAAHSASRAPASPANQGRAPGVSRAAPPQARPGERRRVDGLERARRLLRAALRGLGEAGWPRPRVHLFGFAQGGTVALDAALHAGCGPCAGRVGSGPAAETSGRGGMAALDTALHAGQGTD